jgi:hypothetical protein
MQSLTILTAKNRLCLKSFKQEGNKLVEAYQRPLYRFDHKAIKVDSLLKLSNQLKQLQSRQDCLVIRGQLIAGHPSESIRRTLKASQGKEPNFEHCSRQWCLIDIDDPPLPEHLSDYQNNKTEIVGFAVSHLPEQFHNVKCWYQFSSNMGTKKGKVRLHLWYWLSRPCSDQEMKGWLQESPVDLALFNPVQMHYTANPVFLDGALDPFPDRSGMYEPSDIMEVAVPKLISSVVVK